MMWFDVTRSSRSLGIYPTTGGTSLKRLFSKSSSWSWEHQGQQVTYSDKVRNLVHFLFNVTVCS
jgi:hypothetical protein